MFDRVTIAPRMGPSPTDRERGRDGSRATVVAGLLILVLSATSPTIAGTEEYVVRFDASWSEDTHPADFPPNPHFSGLIGGTHNGSVTFWEVGALASPGIENMAETGSKSPLDDEVQAAIDAGDAGVIISGGGINPSPGTVSQSFDIEEAYPLVTVVSMLAPSPDWFVGVSGVDLFEGGEWVDVKVVPLVVFDAGTDSGTSYTSPNSPTVPPVPIFEKTDGPFAGSGLVGTFTFSRATVSVPDGAGPIVSLLAPRPNPTFGSTTIRLSLTSAGEVQARVFDGRGRLVRQLLDGVLGSGVSSLEWDGRDGNGLDVPAGVYLVDVLAEGRRSAVKVVRVR